jgi:hypothetical protein
MNKIIFVLFAFIISVAFAMEDTNKTVKLQSSKLTCLYDYVGVESNCGGSYRSSNVDHCIQYCQNQYGNRFQTATFDVDKLCWCHCGGEMFRVQHGAVACTKLNGYLKYT